MQSVLNRGKGECSQDMSKVQERSSGNRNLVVRSVSSGGQGRDHPSIGDDFFRPSDGGCESECLLFGSSGLPRSPALRRFPNAKGRTASGDSRLFAGRTARSLTSRHGGCSRRRRFDSQGSPVGGTRLAREDGQGNIRGSDERRRELRLEPSPTQSDQCLGQGQLLY